MSSDDVDLHTLPMYHCAQLDCFLGPDLMLGATSIVLPAPDPATVLPVQVFLWSDEVGRGFVEKTSAAIVVLLVFLLAMNALAIHLRNRFETRW